MNTQETTSKFGNVLRRVTAPVRRKLNAGRAFVVRHRKKLLWAAVGLIVLPILAVCLYLYRAELAAIVGKAVSAAGKFAPRRHSIPVVVVAAAAAEQVPAEPVLNNNGQPLEK